MANGPRACFSERVSGKQAGDEGGGEGIAGADGVGEEFGRLAGEVVTLVAGDERGSVRASREGDGLQRVMSEEMREDRGLIGRAAEHGGELREFFVVELEERGGGQRVEHDLAREMRWTQVDVEDAQAIRSRGGDELAQGVARDRRALCEAAIAHGIGTGGECEQLGRAWDHVPRDVFDDGVARLAGGIQRDGHGAGGMRFERGNEARVESDGVELIEGAMAEIVVADGADDVDLRAEHMRVVGEVAGCAAELGSGGQQVPQQLSEADDDRFVAHE